MNAAKKNWSERLRRFVRWFFTVSPDEVVEPPPRGVSASGRRQDPPRLRAQHARRVHVSERKSS
jgi:hypothetical protein